MSLLVKSDVASTKNLGNVNGLKSTQDWVFYLDFETSEFLERVNGAVQAVTEPVIVSNSHSIVGSPKTMDRNGVLADSPANTLRYWKNKAGRYGVLTEDSRSNYFLNSATPTTQTISLPASSNAIAVSCIGTGSVTVTGTNLNESGSVVTQSSPKAFTVVSAVAHSITVTVTGTLSHVQVEIAGGFTSATSPITTTTATVSRGKDNVSLNNNMLARGLGSGNAMTIVAQIIPHDNLLTDSTVKTEVQMALYSTTTSETLVTSLSKPTSDYQKAQSTYVLNNAISSDKVATDTASKQKWGNVSVLRLNATQFTSASNGALASQITIPSSFTPNVLYIGQGFSSPVARPGSHGIITKLVIFNRALSDDEIIQVSKSWN